MSYFCLHQLLQSQRQSNKLFTDFKTTNQLFRILDFRPYSLLLEFGSLLLLFISVHYHKTTVTNIFPCIVHMFKISPDCILPGHASPIHRGVARNLFWRGTKQGDWGQKYPRGVQGQSPAGGDLVAEPPETEDIYANNHCNNVLIKNPKNFSAWEFPGGGMSPPLPYAPANS